VTARKLFAFALCLLALNVFAAWLAWHLYRQICPS
jgi:hypothetical protein